MRLALSAVALLLVAVNVRAAEPVYLDELMETPLPSLQRHFPSLRREGCYKLADGRFVMIAIEKKKEQKPWRVVLASTEPCRRAEDGPDLDVRQRGGLQLGDSTPVIVEKLGRPDASAAPDPALRKLGDLEYFYVCRVSQDCARHTSIFIRGGMVSAIAEWYSE